MKKRKKVGGLASIALGAIATIFSILPFNAGGQTKVEKQNQRDFYADQPNDSIVSFESEEEQEAFWARIDSTLNSGNQLKNNPVLPSNSDHPMFGMNQWVPAFSPDFTYDWHGSGDWNNDGNIDSTDYNSMVTGTNNYRGDTDLDGISGTAQDKQIVYEYLQGQRDHINIWELETASERINHFTNIVNNVDSIEYIPNSTSGWACGAYTYQTFINYNGVYDIENCDLTHPSPTPLDFSKNGRYRIPIRYVSTQTATGGSHAIAGVFIGAENPENDDITDFNQDLHLEPQTGEIISEGNYSLNNYANKGWYGYGYSDFLQQWLYSSRTIINHDLINGTSNSPNSQLIYSWSPFQQANIPQDQNYEYSTTLETDTSETGIPTNLYPGTQMTFTENSTRTNDSLATDENFDIYRNWNLSAGAYDTTFTQTISVNDNTPPHITSFPVDTIVSEESGNLSPENLGFPTYGDNSALPLSIYWEDMIAFEDDLKTEIKRYWTSEDISGNVSNLQTQGITVMKPVGTNKLEEEVMSVYPNPVKDKLHFNYSNAQRPEKVHFEIYSLDGKAIGKDLIDYSSDQIYSGEGKVEMDVSSLKPGMYFLQTTIDDNTSNSKFVKE
jgi:hypothetical protein